MVRTRCEKATMVRVRMFVSCILMDMTVKETVERLKIMVMVDSSETKRLPVK